MDVLYAALDRSPPFDKIERSAFDIVLTKLPPPPGLTREQVRRAIFEELNFLPWSKDLEPPEDGIWMRHAPVATAVDRVFKTPLNPYRLKRKAMKSVTDQMRADGALGVEVRVDLVEGLSVHQSREGDARISHLAWAGSDRPPPLLQSRLTIDYLDQYDLQLIVRPRCVFLDPNLGEIQSDEQLEHVIRKTWRYGDALYRALVAALPITVMPT